jgi:hypothetical protein
MSAAAAGAGSEGLIHGEAQPEVPLPIRSILLILSSGSFPAPDSLVSPPEIVWSLP